jgi:streptomycin 6-kinase
LQTTDIQFFLHGDLHQDNILQHENKWFAIDPKGVVGDPLFEIAAFDFIHETEKNAPNIKELFESRMTLIGKQSSLNIQRIRDWVFVRLILSAVWSIEDNGDPSWAISLASKLNLPRKV